MVSLDHQVQKILYLYLAWLQKITAAIGVGDEASQLRASTTIDVYKYGKAVGRDKALAEQGKLE